MFLLPADINPSSFSEYVQNQFKVDLTSALNNPILLAGIASHSTVHSNGFFKIVLNSANGFKLRLHVWPLSEFLQEHEPHSHRWDFISYILHGVMVNEILNETDIGEKTFLKCYAHGTNIGSTRGYDVVSENALEFTTKDTHLQGEVYTMRAENIHIAKIPAHTITGTLFLTFPASYDTSTVYMPNLSLPPTETCLSPMNSEDLKSCLLDVISWL